ncbi:AlpA family transcriptional regulator [Terriglobus sp. TAA 43]|uniref:helix-turn-helix transcriptional regulator n=1 Tax=Terriglobus sp. TAA 43 TaxID=278961 RepID=UPI000646A855|nr:AlpA family transcriptional regulator [Terriglobus sp. TAA 43]
METRILRLPEVLKRTGLGKTAVYEAMSRGDFPKSIALLGGRSKGWVEGEIEAFLQSQIAASRAA